MPNNKNNKNFIHNTKYSYTLGVKCFLAVKEKLQRLSNFAASGCLHSLKVHAILAGRQNSAQHQLPLQTLFLIHSIRFLVLFWDMLTCPFFRSIFLYTNPDWQVIATTVPNGSTFL